MRAEELDGEALHEQKPERVGGHVVGGRPKSYGRATDGGGRFRGPTSRDGLSPERARRGPERGEGPRDLPRPRGGPTPIEAATAMKDL